VTFTITSAIACLIAAAQPEPRALRAAVIVGVNEPFEGSQAGLHYADDDAARFWELLRPSLDEIELLTILDAESQKLFPEAAKIARPPDHENLVEALERTFRSAKAAKEAGRRAELYFIYTGHGRVMGGEGEVKLAGGSLTRTELTERVLKSKAHDRMHVIIDACNAYHLVNARGPETAAVTAQFDSAFERFVEEQSIDRFPTVGVVLSTSGAGATHEWSRFQGGVFSHEVRSALSGAADADQDGRVDYPEVEAFIASANLAVPELKGKPKVFVRAPPIDRGAELSRARDEVARVELPESFVGHYWLEDDRGLRYAELNKAEGYRVSIALVPRAQYALVRNDGAEVARFGGEGGVVVLPLEPSRPVPRRARGDKDADDLHIFEEPFGPRFAEGYRARLDAQPDPLARLRVPEEEPLISPTTLGGFAAGGVAVAALAGGIISARNASDNYEIYRTTFFADVRDSAGRDVERDRKLAIGFYASAGVAALASALLFVLGTE
jgi:hypothetical protein